MNFATNETPHRRGSIGRAHQHARERRPASFDLDSDGGFDPSYRLVPSYISIDDAKELLPHSMSQFTLN